MAKAPRSCDTFAVLPSATDGCVIFGKNSDRPADEVQEIVYVPQRDYPQPTKLKCTYIEIEQVEHTHSTVLSKPSWMWGAEMGANEHGLCIGNEAVWTKATGSPDSTERLLGMDLLRLGLERAESAEDAVYVMTELLEEYGQGGNCSDTLPDFTYHNSFLIADPTEVWILETAKKFWAAERITTGVRNISNELSIGTNIDLKSNDLEQHAREMGLWQPSCGPFNFKRAFGFCDDEDDEDCRYKNGERLLKNFAASGNFKETDMFKVLRDKPSGICMSSGSFVSTGSQASTLRRRSTGLPCVHWFTGTPDPSESIFKPFVFAEKIDFPSEVKSHVLRQGRCDRKHALYRLHEDYKRRRVDHSRAMDLEGTFLKRVREMDNVEKVFKEAVEAEIQLYS